MNNSLEGSSPDLHIFIDATSSPIENGESLCRDAIKCVFSIVQPSFSAGHSCHINLKLAEQKEVQELNHRYRDKDKPTNVLSFPDGEMMPDTMSTALGDIIIADEIVQKEALEETKPLSHHLQHLTIHGVLHLYGFDHEEENDAEIMENLECLILKELNIPNPYRDEK